MSIHRDCVDLLYNNVDEDFQKLLLPLNLIQTIYFYPKYRIRDNFITPIGFFNRILSFCVTLIYLILSCYNMLVSNIRNNTMVGIKKIIPITDCIAFVSSCIGFIINFINCVLYSDDNITLVLRLQEVYKLLSCDKTQLKTITIINWASVLALLITDFIMSSSVVYTLKGTSILKVLSHLIYMSFDFNIIYAICMAHLLRRSIVLWNSRVRDRNEFCWKKMLSAYMNILKAYASYQKVFQTYILYHLIETFVLSFVYFQMWLDTYKMKMDGEQLHNILLITLMMFLSWLIKTMFLHITLNIEFERFYIAINEAQTYSMIIDKFDNLSASEQQARKNIQRVNRVGFSKMKVYCLFTIDATLPLRLTYTIATYMIVQLQIAFHLNENEIQDSL